MRLLIAAAAAFALASCTSIDKPIDQRSLADICSGAHTAHLAFSIATAFGKVPAKTVRAERAAWETIDDICADPSVTAADVIQAALLAYIEINDALKEAQ